MNEFRLRDTGAVVTEHTYRLRFPLMSLPNVLAPTDADPVLPAAPPAMTVYQRAVRAGVVQVGEVWRQAWEVVPALVPESVPMLNARLALIQAGHMAAVNTHLAGMAGTDGEQARTFFEFAQNVRRDHRVVEDLRVALALSPAQIDDLFILAKTLE